MFDQRVAQRRIVVQTRDDALFLVLVERCGQAVAAADVMDVLAFEAKKRQELSDYFFEKRKRKDPFFLSERCGIKAAGRSAS